MSLDHFLIGTAITTVLLLVTMGGSVKRDTDKAGGGSTGFGVLVIGAVIAAAAIQGVLQGFFGLFR